MSSHPESAIKYLTDKDFSLAFSDDLSNFVKNRIKEYSFKYIELSTKQSDALLLKVIQTLLSKEIPRSGEHRRDQWEFGWRENLELFGRLFHLSKFDAAKRAAELLERFDLSDAADRGIKGYSGGMRRRLDLAASLIGRPNVLFLDEPTTGLDPRSRQGMWKVIEELVSEGTTVLLTTQYLEEADQLANRIVVLDHGNVIAKGTSNELKSQVGGDRIEIVVDRVSDLAKTAELINGIGSAPATIEEVTKTVLLPVSGGSKAIVDVVRKLDENNIVIADIALRRPTLDDVFLSLTGHATEAPQTPDAPKGRRGRKARR